MSQRAICDTDQPHQEGKAVASQASGSLSMISSEFRGERQVPRCVQIGMHIRAHKYRGQSSRLGVTPVESSVVCIVVYLLYCFVFSDRPFSSLGPVGLFRLASQQDTGRALFGATFQVLG